MRQVWLFLAVASGVGFAVFGQVKLLQPGGDQLLLASATVFALLYMLSTYRERTKSEVTRFGVPAYAVPDDREVELFTGFQPQADVIRFQTLAYALSFGFPNLLYTRLTEVVEAAYRSSILKSTYDLSFVWLREGEEDGGGNRPLTPVGLPEGPGSVAIPLSLLERGQVVSALKVADGQGRGTTPLPSREVNLLNLGVARWYVSQIDASRVGAYLENVEPRYKELLASSDVVEALAIDDLIMAFRTTLGLPAGEITELAVSFLKDTIRFIPICAVVPLEELREQGWPSLTRFTLEFRLSSQSSRPRVQEPGPGRRAADVVRLALGVKLHRYYVSLSNAARARSYHLEIVGPAGTYLANQSVLLPIGARSEDVEVAALAHPRQGQRRARLYVRDMDAPEGQVPLFAARFHERAPGSFLPLAITHLAVALLVTMVMNIAPTLESTAGLGISPLLSLLIALPVGAAAVSGLDGFRRYRHPSLLSITLSAMVFLLSIGSIALLLLGKQLGSIDVLWQLLSTIAWACFLLSSATWLLRATTEAKLRSAVS